MYSSRQQHNYKDGEPRWSYGGLWSYREMAYGKRPAPGCEAWTLPGGDGRNGANYAGKCSSTPAEGVTDPSLQNVESGGRPMIRGAAQLARGRDAWRYRRRNAPTGVSDHGWSL